MAPKATVKDGDHESEVVSVTGYGRAQDGSPTALVILSDGAFREVSTEAVQISS